MSTSWLIPDPSGPGDTVSPFATVDYVDSLFGQALTETEADALYVKKLGDTMVGVLDVDMASPSITLTKDDGGTASVGGKVGSLLRWRIVLGNSATESGSNVGSNFRLERYDDAGSLIDAPISIARDSGIITFSKVAIGVWPSSGDSLTTKTYVDNAISAIVPQEPPPGLTEQDVIDLINIAIANINNPGSPTGVVIDVNVASGNATVSSGDFTTADTLQVINASVQGRTVTLPATAGTVAIVSARTNTRNVDILRGTTGYRLAPGGFVIVYLDGTANYMRVIAASASVNLTSYVAKAGDTMTGALVLPGNPTTNLQAATKQYVDGFVSKAGSTMTGALFLHADPSADAQAATKSYVDGLVDGITGGVLDGYVQVAGDTMTGALQLSGDPTQPLHAATKQYADSLVGSGSSIDVRLDALEGADTAMDARVDALEGRLFQFVVEMAGVDAEVVPIPLIMGDIIIPSGTYTFAGISSVAATGSTVYTLKSGVTTLGTYTFGAAGTTASFVSAGAATIPGSSSDFKMEGPATEDATLAPPVLAVPFRRPI